jgi:hypothetical protein
MPNNISTTTLNTTTAVANKYKPPPTLLISKMIQEKKIIPCESHGAYDLSNYHSNMTGTHAGFHDTQEWSTFQQLKSSQLLSCGSWDNVDIQSFDADWAVDHGSQVLGTSFDPIKLHRKRLEDAHTAMVNNYKQVVAAVQKNNVQAFARLCDRTGPYQSKGKKCQHKGANELLQIYASALNALTPLWELSNRIATAAGGVGPEVSSVSWSLKGLLRVRKKTNEKYNNDFRSVTDIARTSIVFCNLNSLMKGMDYVLSDKNVQVVVVKNRFIADVDGYSDMLMNVVLDDHVCEIQFHLQGMLMIMSAKFIIFIFFVLPMHATVNVSHRLFISLFYM